MHTGSSVLAKAADMSTRVITAKTVNEELHAIERSLRKITMRLQAKPGDVKLVALQARQEAMLQTVINAALEGRTWRHRGEVAGERLPVMTKAKAHRKAVAIAKAHPIKTVD